MRLATTTADFNNYYHNIYDCIDAYKDTGFRYLDYNFYLAAIEGSVLLQEGWQEELSRIRAYAEQAGFRFVQAHSPGGNPLSFDENYGALMLSTERSVKACEILGIKNIVVHAGVAGDVSKETFFDANRKFYAKLFPVMEETGVSVLIENSTRANLGGNYYFYSGRDMRDFLDFVGHPLLGACWDTGHGNIQPDGTQYDNITALGPYLKALHIVDNLGKADDHFAPFFGTVNMDEIMCALQSISYDGYFTFECDNLMINNSWPNYRKQWEKGGKLYNPPAGIKREAVKLLYNIGKHILSSYNCYQE